MLPLDLLPRVLGHLVAAASPPDVSHVAPNLRAHVVEDTFNSGRFEPHAYPGALVAHSASSRRPALRQPVHAAALQTLCLVSRTFCRVAQPLLFHSVAASDLIGAHTSRLRLLLRTLREWAARGVPCPVRRLAITSFQYQPSNDILELISIVAPSLESLIIAACGDYVSADRIRKLELPRARILVLPFILGEDEDVPVSEPESDEGHVDDVDDEDPEAEAGESPLTRDALPNVETYGGYVSRLSPGFIRGLKHLQLPAFTLSDNIPAALKRVGPNAASFPYFRYIFTLDILANYAAADDAFRPTDLTLIADTYRWEGKPVSLRVRDGLTIPSLERLVLVNLSDARILKLEDIWDPKMFPSLKALELYTIGDNNLEYLGSVDDSAYTHNSDYYDYMDEWYTEGEDEWSTDEERYGNSAYEHDTEDEWTTEDDDEEVGNGDEMEEVGPDNEASTTTPNPVSEVSEAPPAPAAVSTPTALSNSLQTSAVAQQQLSNSELHIPELTPQPQQPQQQQPVSHQSTTVQQPPPQSHNLPPPTITSNISSGIALGNHASGHEPDEDDDYEPSIDPDAPPMIPAISSSIITSLTIHDYVTVDLTLLLKKLPNLASLRLTNVEIAHRNSLYLLPTHHALRSLTLVDVMLLEKSNLSYFVLNCPNLEAFACMAWGDNFEPEAFVTPKEYEFLLSRPKLQRIYIILPEELEKAAVVLAKLNTPEVWKRLKHLGLHFTWMHAQLREPVAKLLANCLQFGVLESLRLNEINRCTSCRQPPYFTQSLFDRVFARKAPRLAHLDIAKIGLVEYARQITEKTRTDLQVVKTYSKTFLAKLLQLVATQCPRLERVYVGELQYKEIREHVPLHLHDFVYNGCMSPYQCDISL